jgi:hypothetical protein
VISTEEAAQLVEGYYEDKIETLMGTKKFQRATRKLKRKSQAHRRPRHNDYGENAQQWSSSAVVP